MLIHAGDTSGDEREIERAAGCATKIVLGNNDYSGSLKYEEIFEVDSHRVLLTHGHREGVYQGPDRLIYKAAEMGADIVVYGHTHVPSVEYDEDLNVWAVNPGSLTYPRQEGHKPSFIIMQTDTVGDVHFTINYL